MTKVGMGGNEFCGCLLGGGGGGGVFTFCKSSRFRVSSIKRVKNSSRHDVDSLTVIGFMRAAFYGILLPLSAVC